MNKQVNEITLASLALMKRYPWPGNVRELENIIERAMIAAAGSVLELDPNWLTAPITKEASSPQGFREVERHTIEQALKRANGKIYGPGGAAEALRLKPTTLYGKMRKLGIGKKSRETATDETPMKHR